MNDQLSALRLFVRVARTGSFSRAARDLQLSQPTVSRTIAWLEEELGAKLFARTTRALALTQAGARYLERVEVLLESLDEASFELRGSGELRGTLRVGLSSSLAVLSIIPLLPQFTLVHPGLKVDLKIEDRHQDMITEGLDLVLRFGHISDSTFVARPLVTWPRFLVAAPSYLHRAMLPVHPHDLVGHAAITGQTGNSTAWSLTRGDETISVRVAGQVTVSTNHAAIVASAAGLGIVAATPAACGQQLETGALVRVLKDWTLPPLALHAVFVSGRSISPSARAFLSFLKTQLDGGGAAVFTGIHTSDA